MKPRPGAASAFCEKIHKRGLPLAGNDEAGRPNSEGGDAWPGGVSRAGRSRRNVLSAVTAETSPRISFMETL